MLEVLLLMLAASVQSAAALDNTSTAQADVAAITAPAVPTPADDPAPADDSPATLADDDPPPADDSPAALADDDTAPDATPAPVAPADPAPQQTSSLNLPVFPPAPSATQPAPEPAPQPAPVILAPTPAPEPAPQPAPVILTPPTPQPAPEPAPQPSTQLAFLAPKPDAPTPGLVAEPQVPSGRFLTALEVRPILNATRSNWIAVREYAGKDLLYVTHIWSWRCGLLELKVGLNGAPPEPWPLPPCHLDQPQAAAILEGDGNPYREFALRSVQLIEVVLTYDDLTTERVRFNRAGVVIP